MLYIELVVVLSFLVVAVRLGDIGVGAAAGGGVVMLAAVFGCPVGTPPLDVVMIVLTVVAAAATLQAGGGLDKVVRVASKLLRRYPNAVVFIAPLVTYTFTLMSGTGYVAYAVLPVIVEVAISAGVRPERPLASAVIASQLAITASPMSAATAAMVGLLTRHEPGLALPFVLAICVPATFVGSMAAALYSYLRGGPLVCVPAETAAVPHREHKLADRSATLALLIFGTAIVTVVILGLSPDLRSIRGSTALRVGMPDSLQLIMLSAIAAMLLFCRVRATDVSRTTIMQAGVGAAFSILGVTWLGATFFEGNRDVVIGQVSGVVLAHPWAFSILLFALSAIVYSQTATVAALMGIGLSLGVPPRLLVAMYPAVNGFFFFPTSGTIVAAVSLDRTGSTRIGRYVLNHSFMIPGLVGITASVLTGLLLVKVML